MRMRLLGHVAVLGQCWYSMQSTKTVFRCCKVQAAVPMRCLPLGLPLGLPARESFVVTFRQPEAYLVRRLDISTQQVQPRQPHATSALMDLERDLEGRVYSRRLAERPTNSLNLGAYPRCPTNSVTHGSGGKQSAVALRLSPILTALLVLVGCH